jgi:hypothetical protein
MMDIDLNLLRVFEILYDERNVTRAAARLFLTQSAVSHALARLRDVLGDPLFMRIPSGLQPTERDPQCCCDTHVRSGQDPPALHHFGRSLFLHADRP